MKKLIALLTVILIFACKGEKPETLAAIPVPKIIYEYGFKLNDYKVIHDTIKSGENFSEILDRHHIEYPKVLEIVNKIKDTFNVRRIKSGIPYTILAKTDLFFQHSTSPDSLPTVLFEAIKSKIPVIATDLGGAVEILHNGDCGLLVSPNNAVKTASKIHEYANDKATQKINIEKAITHTQELFSPAQFKENILAEFENAITNNTK